MGHRPRAEISVVLEVGYKAFKNFLVGNGSHSQVKGNTFEKHTQGFVMGDVWAENAIMGEQNHHANSWLDDFTEGALFYGNEDFVNLSRFRVDNQESSQYLPETVIPLSWFEDIDDGGSTYQVKGTVKVLQEQKQAPGALVIFTLKVVKCLKQSLQQQRVLIANYQI